MHFENSLNQRYVWGNSPFEKLWNHLDNMEKCDLRLTKYFLGLERELSKLCFFIIFNFFEWNQLKTQPKKDKFEVPPHGFDQLLHINQLWRAGKIWKKNTFFVHFQMFFVGFSLEINKKGSKSTKKVENGWKSSLTS